MTSTSSPCVPRILAVDTSGNVSSMALLSGEQCWLREIHAMPHSQTFLPEMQDMLREAGVTLEQVDVYAWGQGPGAFTGVRLGCCVIQGFSCALGQPIISISSLEALADQQFRRMPDLTRVLVATDARMNEVYYAGYELTGWENIAGIRVPRLQEILPHGCVPPAELPLLDGTDWLAVGNGWSAYAATLQPQLDARGIRCVSDVQVLAVDVAHQALLRWQAGETQTATEITPLYVRDKVAQTIAERLAQGGKA